MEELKLGRIVWKASTFSTKAYHLNNNLNILVNNNLFRRNKSITDCIGKIGRLMDRPKEVQF